MSILDNVNWAEVRQRYDARLHVHEELLSFRQQNAREKFADLALGIENPDGNYSAAENRLGPKILASNDHASQKILDFAGKFMAIVDGHRVPALIKAAGLQHLQFGVGSEISCMSNPTVCWVVNTRTIWTHLAIKNGDDIARADKELKLYRDSDGMSGVGYENWAAVYNQLEVVLKRLAKQGQEQAKKANIIPGNVTSLWSDAIASQVYGMHHD